MERYRAQRLAMLNPNPVTYRCLCCGITRSFKSEVEAAEAEWDTPGWFPPEGLVSPLCPHCPTWQFLRFDHPLVRGYAVPARAHDSVHRAWLDEGRHPSGLPYTYADYIPGPIPAEKQDAFARLVRHQIARRN